MSTDELTGVQALERQHPALPLAPGKVERREFEYVRHGTRSFIISRDVATGQIVEPYGGPRRTEADFLQHVQGVIASDVTARCWHFVVDNLDTHRSESLVRWVAAKSGVALDLGEKGKKGILKNRQSRAAFLSDPSHRVVFHYTPKHTSWMNQVEIWLSILVRKLLKRGSFTSVDDLQQKVISSTITTGPWRNRSNGPIRARCWPPNLWNYLGQYVLDGLVGSEVIPGRDNDWFSNQW
jgi:transposase